jgi:MipA family protein
MLLSRTLIAALLVSAPLTPAGAQDASEPVPQARDRDTITVGAGAAVIPSYEGSNDYVVIPAGAIRGRVSGFNFSSRGTVLSVDALRDRSRNRLDIQLGPVVNFNFNRVGRIVDRQVRALGSRRLAFEAGGFFGIAKTGVFTSAYDTLGASVTVLADTTGIHQSYTISPAINYGTPLSSRAYLGVSLAGTWAGDGYARTYFAVDAAGAVRSGLPQFTGPRGGFKNYTVGALGNYVLRGDLERGLGLYVVGAFSQYQGDFARSPVVSVAGSRNQFFGAVGLGYAF